MGGGGNRRGGLAGHALHLEVGRGAGWAVEQFAGMQAAWAVQCEDRGEEKRRKAGGRMRSEAKRRNFLDLRSEEKRQSREDEAKRRSPAREAKQEANKHEAK